MKVNELVPMFNGITINSIYAWNGRGNTHGVNVVTKTEPDTPSVVASEGNPYGISYDRMAEAIPELRQTVRGLIGTE